MLTIKEIVAEYLEDNGYDGLYNVLEKRVTARLDLPDGYCETKITTCGYYNTEREVCNDQQGRKSNN